MRIVKETYNQDQVDEIIASAVDVAKKQLLAEIEDKFTHICCEGCDCEHVWTIRNTLNMKHCWRWVMFKENILG